MAALTAAEQPLCASLWRRLIVMAAASAAGTQLQRQRWQAALHLCAGRTSFISSGVQSFRANMGALTVDR